MTYFGFLGVFVCIPILLLWLVWRFDAQRGRRLTAPLRPWHPGWVLLAHVIIAVVYTTPWDNYLVATRVWWYNRDLVTGLTIGYVPIEEYTFFILQPLLTGSWLFMLLRHSPLPAMPTRDPMTIRRVMTLVVFVAWLFFVWLLFFSGWRPGTYLGLLFVWALPPVMLQTWFGGDILWRHRKAVLLSVIPMTLYLAASDKLAITSGTWTINPEQSLEAIGILIMGRLPVEEFLFFMMTNILITLGCMLMTSADSQARARRWLSVVKATLGWKAVSGARGIEG